MGEVIFCATDFYLQGGYRSYVDYFRLVELAGYKIIPLSELDPDSDNTYLVTPLNDQWLAGWQSPKARIIHWEFEWRTDWRATVNEPPGVSEVWAMDKAYAEKIGARYVPVGGDERLNKLYMAAIGENNTPSEYEVSLLSYQTYRRQLVTAQLENLGVKLAPTSNLWGYDRTAALCNSRAMVHVHQLDNMAGIASLRWCLAAAHHLPIITETVPDRGIFTHTYMPQADYEYLAAFTANMLKDGRMLADYGAALHQLLCVDMTFRKVVDAHV